MRSRDYAFGVPSCGSMTADMGCFDRAGSSFGRSDFALDDRGIWLLTMNCPPTLSKIPLLAQSTREKWGTHCVSSFWTAEIGYPHISLCDGEGSRTGVPAPHGPAPRGTIPYGLFTGGLDGLGYVNY